ncbi:MAG: hypothetical protein ACK4PR_08275 [Gammaproteobacteria bacterium]
MFRYYDKVALALLTGLFAQAAFSMNDSAPVTDSLTALPTSSFVITMSGGAAWESAGQKQTLTLSPDIQKTYTANQPTNTLIEGELFLGMQKPLTYFKGSLA